MATYERRPERVEAVQWAPGIPIEGVYTDAGWKVWTKYGAEPLNKGDWILTTAEGIRLKMDPYEFAKKYKAVK